MKGSIYSLICYYLIGLPLALWLAFNHGMGLFGIWLGFSITCIIINIGLLMIIECSNTPKITAKMQKQLDKEKIKKIAESVKKGQLLPDEEFAGMSGSTQSAKAL